MNTEQIFGPNCPLAPPICKMLKHRAFQASPHEICGFVLDDGEIIEVANVAENSMRDFQMDRMDVARRLTLDQFSRIFAVWHSHPKGSTVPSRKDIEAINIGTIQHDWVYAIVTEKTIAIWNPKSFMPQDDSFWNEFCA